MKNQARDRRQTSDPDQLCPTLATFVMPRAGLNAQGATIVSKPPTEKMLPCFAQETGCTL